MRRTILLSLFVLFAVSAANHVRAQHRGEGRGGHGFSRSRGDHDFNRSEAFLPYGFGYEYVPPFDYDDSYNDGPVYDYAPQPVPYVQQPTRFVQPPARPVAHQTAHPVITEYTWPAAGAASSPSVPSTTSESEPQAFAIVLKDGSTLSAVTVFASEDILHYVDPDARHLRVSMSLVDRAATLKLNRARNLNLYLPAAQ